VPQTANDRKCDGLGRIDRAGDMTRVGPTFSKRLPNPISDGAGTEVAHLDERVGFCFSEGRSLAYADRRKGGVLRPLVVRHRAERRRAHGCRAAARRRGRCGPGIRAVGARAGGSRSQEVAAGRHGNVSQNDPRVPRDSSGAFYFGHLKGLGSTNEPKGETQ